MEPHHRSVSNHGLQSCPHDIPSKNKRALLVGQSLLATPGPLLRWRLDVLLFEAVVPQELSLFFFVITVELLLFDAIASPFLFRSFCVRRDFLQGSTSDL